MVNLFFYNLILGCLVFKKFNESTYTGLPLNFKSFTSFLYKISLIKYLIDRSFKICNNWNSFHNDIQNIKSNFIKIRSISSHPFTIDSVPLAPFFLCLFFFCYFLQFSFIYCFHFLYAKYRHLLLS